MEHIWGEILVPTTIRGKPVHKEGTFFEARWRIYALANRVIIRVALASRLCGT